VSKATPERVKAIRGMHAEGKPITEIAHVVGLGRQTIYRILGRWQRRGLGAQGVK
jgi:transposase